MSNDATNNDTERTFQTEEVREILDRFKAEEFAHTENVTRTIEEFTKQVVESGTFIPDCNVTAEVSLTLQERISGTRQQDMTAMLVTGMMIGSALERDVPKDSDRETAWKEGAFEIPDQSDDPETNRGGKPNA